MNYLKNEGYNVYLDKASKRFELAEKDGIIINDLGPGNIGLTKKGKIKIIDPNIILKENAIVSPMYIVFKITDNNLIPEYLKLWFSRKEFQRSTYFYAMGSVRDTFAFNLMQEVQIPLPPKEVQQKIVDLYNCYEECKRIAKEAREKIRNLCPALVQKAAHSR